MSFTNPQDDVVRQLLRSSKVIAVVGLSPKEERPSYGVAKYLQKSGYQIVPVNPGHAEILGEKAYPTLSAIPFPVDIVDVFRRSEEVGPVAEEAVKIKAKALWFQEGVWNEEAAQQGVNAGLTVLMDRCTAKEHYRLKP